MTRKQINKAAKGRINEKRCADELKAEGYIIWKTISNKWQKIDLWGLFDVAALHPDGKHIRLIQVKTNRRDIPQEKAIINLKTPSCVIKEMWIWYDSNYRGTRRGWKKKIFLPGVLTTLVNNKEVNND